VHRIPLPLPNDGLRAVNVYVLADDGGLTLIDSGWALEEGRRRLEEGLARIGHELGDVRRFLVTHIHRDHYTMAMAVRRLFGSRILLGAGEQPSLDLILHQEHASGPFGLLLRECGAAEVLARIQAQSWPDRDAGGDWEKPDEWLSGTDEITLPGRTLRVVPTPGHTRGHVVFADLDHGLLFAGDHVLPHITPSIGFEPARPALPLGDYLASLRLARSLPDLRLLPAHGAVGPSSHARIDELIAHHGHRLEACAAVFTDGAAANAYQVAQRLPWTRRERRLDDLDPYNQMLAVMETAAHLDVLVRDGRLASSTADGVVIYTA